MLIADINNPFRTSAFRSALREQEAQRAIESLSASTDDHICSRFGCGRSLTLNERLYGNNCINHQEELNRLPVVVCKHEQVA